ncbi:MAG: hypothetical protein KAJ91_01730 [Candidatus Aenigmarchaeota archaeon]|nr:hypothetical protein [Candidatus Aenigmarchaeota archaeon]MCK5334110.1 hypothetical protein [Candidatus Aenigmarchaeota archaeon]
MPLIIFNPFPNKKIYKQIIKESYGRKTILEAIIDKNSIDFTNTFDRLAWI